MYINYHEFIYVVYSIPIYKVHVVYVSNTIVTSGVMQTLVCEIVQVTRNRF